MFNFQKVLQEIQKSVFCPICKRKYSLKEIKIRGFFDETLILEVKCNSRHEPVTAIIIAQPKRNKTKNNKKINPITSHEAEQFKQNIRQFKGNFCSK